MGQGEPSKQNLERAKGKPEDELDSGLGGQYEVFIDIEKRQGQQGRVLLNRAAAEPEGSNGKTNII
jgi:hypothetical protein